MNQNPYSVAASSAPQGVSSEQPARRAYRCEWRIRGKWQYGFFVGESAEEALDSCRRRFHWAGAWRCPLTNTTIERKQLESSSRRR